MDNVLVKARGPIWDEIIYWFKQAGYWNNVIKWEKKPSVQECLSLIKKTKLPDNLRNKFEYSYDNLSVEWYYIIDRLIRKTDWGTDRYNSSSFHELSGRIRLYYLFFAAYLYREKISLVIFWNTPHMGWDNILYEVAKQHEIKTLILDQSKFPNKFFHYFNFKDFGNFNTSIALDRIERVPIEKKVEKDWLYIKKHWGVRSKITLKKLLSPSKYKKRVNQIIENNDFLRLAKDVCFPENRPQAYFRFITERTFKKNYHHHCKSQVDLKMPYVYFPLHNQPERATQIWGGIYTDQVLALERLRDLLPDDWFIFVKESPKQRGAFRGDTFFKRLNNIPNLVYLSSKVNTFDLIKNSLFISTIVGTAGWEAISGGKNVLCFGWGQWYKNLPGVYHYSPEIDVNTLVESKFDHTLLEKKVALLLNKCGTGIIYEAYLPTIKDFSMPINTETVSQSLVKILYSSEPNN